MRLHELVESIKLAPFDLANSTPTIQDYYKNPEYHKKQKGMQVDLEYMTPREYIKQAEKFIDIKWNDKNTRLDQFGDTVHEYAEAMRMGDKFPTPYLDFRTSGQEGLHRAEAAEMIGIDKIPVYVITHTPDAEKHALKRERYKRNQDREYNKKLAAEYEDMPDQEDITIDDLLNSFK